MTETILANATLILPGEVIRGALRMADGRITAIDQGGAVPPGAVDCGGDLVMPGLIELHTDNLERHIQPRPRVHWPHQAAILAHDGELAGTGITTVFDALRVGSVVSDGKANYGEYARALANEILELRAMGALKISHYLHLRAEVCSETLVAEMAKFGPRDRIGIVSLMDHTPGERQFRDLSKLKEYVCGKHGLSDEGFADHVASQRALRDRLGALHEATAVAEARRYGAVLASHDDTTAGQVAVSAGHGAHFAEFPTTAEAASACRDHGILVMMGAPNLIRGGSHSGNVAAAELAEAGLLDILSSDYVPSSLLSAALLLGDLWDDMARGIATVTQAPAEATGLGDRGRLQHGMRADVIRVARIGGGAALRGAWVQGRRVA
ncbi:alpha-D-ribose 1-methylphosphonate 5-triphosphate diphosphatase [Paracoccus denitrificans]|jgi:alpha-D-ribose 1-methylphosphonate 5-triphosphate diphosphatase|uniref:Phosphonate metabolism protein PhnM n=1 Tax=Paracoccus denitrificans (strain Pd 1222) TaxID=318586 RepID=A1BBE1_PARDP|nr:alpha-D-ribose 1-methylphosphonate 5-triphosphate diphosphatase [Paracoccus denitrificans]ABL72835.1 phosphonate metabolism protein PhnM [Paracoccus denitrificans PD1222]MBB4626314.1 alpha-D-ribose 1-methylphosphonate 5-triphosphate diphosphatase [Paracoccus denitrificans]MCU7427481.1 alpha-D-ribose 1-methylphosphonate 5-triphosphate diphosphatase [Paracoccus denitrificans]QAR29246.1 alpha-D-ribose 1-methylphosphonate 5-triphosphate diphosphatase [Paracoccus denitrificans]UFS68170.1 alpha-D